MEGKAATVSDYYLKKPIDLYNALATRSYYVEFKNGPDGFWCNLYCDGGMCFLFDVSIYKVSERNKKSITIPAKLYNKTWRLWKWKPGEEERNNARWK